MKFDEEIPIYIQIENFIRDKIFSGIWKENDRIPSVRELAGLLEVNPNTVMRTYEKLQSAKIIYMQRGLGCYVEKGSIEIINNDKKNNFFVELNTFFKSMQELGISIETINTEYQLFVIKNKLI